MSLLGRSTIKPSTMLRHQGHGRGHTQVLCSAQETQLSPDSSGLSRGPRLMSDGTSEDPSCSALHIIPMESPDPMEQRGAPPPTSPSSRLTESVSVTKRGLFYAPKFGDGLSHSSRALHPHLYFLKLNVFGKLPPPSPPTKVRTFHFHGALGVPSSLSSWGVD